mmetsp:Transcript_80103/g.192142  ORF Transcript_80103/g.192142 Transcript_80103/m.192142 type:complete len:370 (+) Transcript_80103:313-1422(+)
MQRLEVLHAGQLVMLPFLDQFLDLPDKGGRHPPPLQLVPQRRQLQLSKHAPVHLPGRLAGHGQDLRTAEAVRTLKMALLAVGVLEVIQVSLLERLTGDLRISAQLLLPPAHGVLEGEAAVLKEGPQLEPAGVLQVLLVLTLALHQATHAGGEGAGHELLEVLRRQLLPRILGGGAGARNQLQPVVLQRLEEAPHAHVHHRDIQALEGHVQALRQLLLEALGHDQLQHAGGHKGLAALKHHPPPGNEVRGHLLKREGVEDLLILRDLPLFRPDLGARRALLQLVQIGAVYEIVPAAVHAHDSYEGLLCLCAESLEAQHKEALLLPQEPLPRISGLAKGQAQRKVGHGVPPHELRLVGEEALHALLALGVA